jgi:hypothetical protein
MNSFLDFGWAKDKKEQADEGMRNSEAAFQAELKRLRDSSGSGSGSPPTTTVVGVPTTTPTSLPSGQSYA